MRRVSMVSVWMVMGCLLPVVGAEEVVVPPAAPRAADKAKQDAAAKLNGTAWEVEFSPMSGEKMKKPMHDALQFDKGQFTSTMLTKDGYGASNYTLSVGDDGIPVWETMQSGEHGMASWRGELHGETMTGIFSRHPTEGAAQDYSFLGHQTGVAASMNESSPPVSSMAAPAAQPAASTPAAPSKPKKKGWFGR